MILFSLFKGVVCSFVLLGRVSNYPCLKFIYAYLITILLWLDSSVLYCFKWYQFLFAFLFARVLFNYHLHVFFETLPDSPPHEAPLLRSKSNIFFLDWAVVEASWGLDGVAVGNISEYDGTGSWFFEFRDSKEAAVITKYVSLITNDLGQYSCFIVVVLPNIVARTIQEHILLYRMSMQVQKYNQPILVLPF